MKVPTPLHEMCINTIYDEIKCIASEKNLPLDSYLQQIVVASSIPISIQNTVMFVLIRRLTKRLEKLYGFDNEVTKFIIKKWLADNNKFIRENLP